MDMNVGRGEQLHIPADHAHPDYRGCGDRAAGTFAPLAPVINESTNYCNQRGPFGGAKESGVGGEFSLWTLVVCTNPRHPTAAAP